MQCPVCGKPYQLVNDFCFTIDTLNTTMSSLSGTMYIPVCLCYIPRFTPPPMASTQPLLIRDGSWLSPPEEEPLEWSEVEQQLDAYMAELNKGRHDDGLH